jgi:hypothetical protein
MLECGGERHRLRWEAGELRALDHGDPEGERALAALGGERCACVQALEVWARHAQDPHVLVLGSRGPGDPVPAGRPRTSGPSGWASATPRGGPARRRTEPMEGLFELLGLGGGLPERLAAGVIAARLTLPDPAGDAYLGPALYGRVALALRAWLGDAACPIAVTPTRAGEPLGLHREDGALRAELPVSWLLEVWARGLAVVWGRFVLAAACEHADRLALTTVGPDLGPTSTGYVSWTSEKDP